MKNWFITGASRGFGRHWTEAALARGDRVVATARNVNTLRDLTERFGDAVLALPLDVTDRAAAVAAVTRAHEAFGRLDVVVNNAGYGLFGAVEEVTEEQARAQLETNFFGALWVTQAVLPYLREQRSGHILQVSSIGGVCAFPLLGLYHASKWALEGMSETLAQEVSEFGIHVTLIEPGGFDTDWRGSSSVWTEAVPAYAALHESRRTQRGTGAAPGDPAATAAALLKLVDTPEPPLRAFLGTGPFPVARAAYQRRLATWEQWDDLARSAQGN